MTTIINKICQNENFIRMLEEAISNDIDGMDSSVVDYNEGRAYGSVTSYDIISSINFKSYNVENLNVTFELEFTGEANINYKKPGTDGEDDDKTIEGFGSANVRVTVPDRVLIVEDIDDIIKDFEIEVTDVSAYLNEEDEVDEEGLNESEEYFERRSKLESLSTDTLIDMIISLEKEKEKEK